jgi:hypothetical protein
LRNGPVEAVAPVDAKDVWSADTAKALEIVLEGGVSWLAETDLIALVMLREHLETMSLHRQRMSLVGATPEEVRAWNSSVSAAMSILGKLGFDPASRSALGLAEVVKMSKLDELRQQWAEEDSVDVIDV